MKLQEKEWKEKFKNKETCKTYRGIPLERDVVVTLDNGMSFIGEFSYVKLATEDEYMYGDRIYIKNNITGKINVVACINKIKSMKLYNEKGNDKMWESAGTLEHVQNNSICVLQDNKYIRNMKYINDINETLVLVSNIPTIYDKEDFIIKKGDMCRYRKVWCIDKDNINIDVSLKL
jgi:hypothetical protein